ncbi:hypothetical protein PSHT_04929 [Puccinia striiformis]|uniref:Uncharacterized protein n=1 Tax=Puccinia striiformis TaxID=27350 RepID=A0A2S4WBT0_9BASI|nr:hypothetical protein PSHT_04929 [Puccinia striiformis]
MTKNLKVLYQPEALTKERKHRASNSKNINPKSHSGPNFTPHAFGLFKEYAKKGDAGKPQVVRDALSFEMMKLTRMIKEFNWRKERFNHTKQLEDKKWNWRIDLENKKMTWKKKRKRKIVGLKSRKLIK